MSESKALWLDFERVQRLPMMARAIEAPKVVGNLLGALERLEGRIEALEAGRDAKP